MHSFLWLSNIPLCVCTTTSLSIHLSMDIFHVLAVVNSAAMNNGIHVSFSIFVSSGYTPKSGIPGSYGGFIPSFLRNLHTVFQCLYQFTFPPTVQECSLCSTSFPAFIVRRLFDDSHSNQCEVICHCNFNLHFSNSDVEYLFMCLLDICISSLKKCLFRPSTHIFIGLLVYSMVKR